MAPCLALLIVLGFAPPAGGELVVRAKTFRTLLELGEMEAARALMSETPRRWWESREGEGAAWSLSAKAGPWAEWDDHFGSEKIVVAWREGERSATAVVRETNDFFRLLERGWVTNEIRYFFDENDRIEGLLIRGVGERPPGLTEEFRAWARAHAPAELDAMMPGGEIDPSDPPRFRRLLNRWRKATGREPILKR